MPMSAFATLRVRQGAATETADISRKENDVGSQRQHNGLREKRRRHSDARARVSRNAEADSHWMAIRWVRRRARP